MIPAVLGAVAAGGGVSDAFELIQTQTVGAGGAASVTFTSIPGTYKHLQIRGIVKSAGTDSDAYLRFNGDTSTIYRYHNLVGNGTTASSGGGSAYENTLHIGPFMSAQFAAHIVDILDYTSTSKNKVMRNLTGYDNNGAGFAMLYSGIWASTAAITSITLYGVSNTAQYSTFSLYGVK